MSIYSKPLSQLDTSDLAELLAEKAVENVRLEFKSTIPDRDETLKKLSSFANTFGGYVVIGAEADKSGRIVGLPGVAIESGYKQKLVAWCYESVSPALDINVSDPVPVPSGSGQCCYVIYVPESDLTPHFLNSRRGAWIRTDEFSQKRLEAALATEQELRLLIDRRRAVLDRREHQINRARDRFATLVATRYSKNTNKGSIGARLLLSIVPRYPSRQVCDQGRLLDVLRDKRIPWRGEEFPRNARDIISQNESGIVLNSGIRFSQIEVNTWGLCFYALEIEGEEGERSGIHLNHLAGHLLVFLQHASLIMSEIGIVGPLNVELSLEGIRGVPWLYFPMGSAQTKPASELDNVASLRMDTTSEELGTRPHGVLMDMLQFVFFALNWEGVARNREELRQVVRAGYEYNWIKPPGALLE